MWRRIENYYWHLGWSSGNAMAAGAGALIVLVGSVVWGVVRPKDGPGWIVPIPATAFLAFYIVLAMALRRRERAIK